MADGGVPRAPMLPPIRKAISRTGCAPALNLGVRGTRAAVNGPERPARWNEMDGR